jgi:hypothetical protein
VQEGIPGDGPIVTELEWILIGVLAAPVPGDVVDDAIGVTGEQAERSDGKLPPHVVALALFAGRAEEVSTLTSWGCWDQAWSVPTSQRRWPGAA